MNEFNNVTFMLGAAAAKQFPTPDLPEIAMAGRSNVGKSSLINKLTGRRNLARTSKTPGRTREINFFDVDGIFRLVDLPGYGYAKAPKQIIDRWQHLLAGYLTNRSNLALVVTLLDSRHEPTAKDRILFDLLMNSNSPFAVALTKSDKLTQRERSKQERLFAKLFPQSEIIMTSAQQGEGIEALQTLILNAVKPTG